MSFFTKHAVKKPHCIKCKLDQTCHTPRMGYGGGGAKKILIITDFPGKSDDISGQFYVSADTVALSRELATHGIAMQKDCWLTYSIGCFPGDDDGPSPTQLEACKLRLTTIIDTLKPTKILLLGPDAVQTFYGARNSNAAQLEVSSGQKYWDSIYKTWVFPMWAPTALTGKNKLLPAVYKRSLARAMAAPSAPLDIKWNKVVSLLDYNQVIEFLNHVFANETLIAIDYETTGLDIYKKGHKTVSMAIATKDGAWSYLIEHPYWRAAQQEEIKALTRKILQKRKIQKIVQGIPFEYQWTKKVMEAEARSFFWDTQLATHVLDNRRYVTGLKYQAFQRWGIEDYESFAKPYIETDPATGFNNMLKMPVDALLRYNGLDALYTYQLYVEQQGEFVGREFKAYQFFHEGAITLCEMSCNGISVREDYYARQRVELVRERDALTADIFAMDEVKAYNRRFGTFNMDSPQDMQRMLFDIMGLTATKVTAKGNASVDAEVLGKVDTDLTRKVVQIRKIGKMISTYIDGPMAFMQDGMLHPYFTLSRARSFRSSSQYPNFQNVPKRDPKAKKIIRSGIVPRKGRVLGELDFSGAEISTSIYYHKDPTFIDYQLGGNADMHKDSAAYIWKLQLEMVHKELRQAIKGGWTFAQFYGSYYVSCAKQMWEECRQLPCTDGSTVQDHLEASGLTTYKLFEAHVKKFERVFWDEWFPVYTAWKKQVVVDYIRTGYVETFMGFRFKGLMDEKQCTNYPVQGTSFHLLLYTATAVLKEIKAAGLQTLIIGQIHDSLILDIPVEEVDIIKDMVTRIVRGLHHIFDWMCVPMDLDLEVSDSYENGGSFAHMTKLAIPKMEKQMKIAA